MKKIEKIIQVVLSVPLTIYFNFRALSFKQAVKMPFLVNYKTHISKISKGIVVLPENIHFAMIKIGWGGSEGVYSHAYSEIFFEKGTVVFRGNAFFSTGISIRNSGMLEFGKNFSTNKNVFISCSSKIVFGNDVLIGWNVSIRDSDGHSVYYHQKRKESKATVNIGNHVWICSETHILKGVSVMDNSIVAYGSLVTKSFDKDAVLIAGAPAQIVHDDINWEI